MTVIPPPKDNKNWLKTYNKTTPTTKSLVTIVALFLSSSLNESAAFKSINRSNNAQSRRSFLPKHRPLRNIPPPTSAIDRNQALFHSGSASIPPSLSPSSTENIRTHVDDFEQTPPNKKQIHRCTSLSGVPYSSVQSGLDVLYPPSQVSSRNAASRADGYWKFIKEGGEPPVDLTYGEFDFRFFAELMDVAWGHYIGNLRDDRTCYDEENGEKLEEVEGNGGGVATHRHIDEMSYQHYDNSGHGNENNNNKIQSKPPWKNKVLADIGSGTGRLVIGAAALHPHWKVCRGLELLEGIHNVAVENLEKCDYSDNGSRNDYIGECNGNVVASASDDLYLEFPTTATTTATIHDACRETESSASNSKNDSNQDYLPLAPITFQCGSFTDPDEYLGDIDCAFVFSTCFSPDLMQELSWAIGSQFKVGSIVITTEYPLVLGEIHERFDDDDCNAGGVGVQCPPHMQQYLESLPRSGYFHSCSDESSYANNGGVGSYYDCEIELIDVIDGDCGLVGGTSTAYIHRVVETNRRV